MRARQVHLLLRLLLVSPLLISCSNIDNLGALGPKKMGVYSISQNSFFSSSKMLVIVNKKGDIVAYTGGTVEGMGTVGLQAASTILGAGAIYYGAKSIQSGLQSSSVTVKGVPSHVDVNGIPSHIGIDSNIHVK